MLPSFNRTGYFHSQAPKLARGNAPPRRYRQYNRNRGIRPALFTLPIVAIDGAALPNTLILIGKATFGAANLYCEVALIPGRYFTSKSRDQRVALSATDKDFFPLSQFLLHFFTGLFSGIHAVMMDSLKDPRLEYPSRLYGVDAT